MRKKGVIFCKRYVRKRPQDRPAAKAPIGQEIGQEVQQDIPPRKKGPQKAKRLLQALSQPSAPSAGKKPLVHHQTIPVRGPRRQGVAALVFRMARMALDPDKFHAMGPLGRQKPLP